MNRNDIQNTLATLSQAFVSTANDNAGQKILKFAFPADQEGELKALAAALKGIFNTADNYIEVSKASGENNYNILISAPQLNPPLFLAGVPLLNSDYNELLFQKSQGATVKIGLELFQKKVEKTAEEIAKEVSQEDFDPYAVVAVDEPYYISVDIPLAGDFAVKSDEQYVDPAEFAHVDPATALYLAAQVNQKK